MKPILLSLLVLFSLLSFAGDYTKNDIFSVYPNPSSSGNINIKFNVQHTHFEYKLYDFTGNELITGKANSEYGKSVAIDVSKLPVGNYFLIVSNENNRITKRVTLRD